MTELTTPEVFTTNFAFVNKHSSYKKSFSRFVRNS